MMITIHNKLLSSLSRSKASVIKYILFGKMLEKSTSTRTNGDDEPVAGLSSASACIQISICPSFASSSDPTRSLSEPLTFRPVFTHQSFPDEYLPGWRPLVDAERQAELVYRSWKGGQNSSNTPDHRDRKIHPSFAKQDYNRDNNSRIDVHVKLAPSCSQCEIEIETTDSKGNNDDGPVCKKMKVTFEDAHHKMEINEILDKLSLALPNISCVRLNDTAFDRWSCPDNKSGIQDELRYLNKPIGRIVKSYHRKIRDTIEEAKFVITIAEGAKKEASVYHNSIQKIARWFIETADDVDISGGPDESGDSGGFWSVMYLFREHNLTDEESKQDNSEQQSAQYSLAGYVTLFHFHAPFKKPQPGVVVRICQALILPPYQRAGHGSDMLHSVYDYAKEYSGNGMNIVEVNVEDPAPSFVALRDFVDYQRFAALLGTSAEQADETAVTDAGFFLPISEDSLQRDASSLKVTKRQAQIVHEMHKLHQLEKWKQQTLNEGSEGCGKVIEGMETQYRLMIKRSLRTNRKEELGACTGGKEEQKALLEQWFQQTLTHYRKLLGFKD